MPLYRNLLFLIKSMVLAIRSPLSYAERRSPSIRRKRSPRRLCNRSIPGPSHRDVVTAVLDRRVTLDADNSHLMELATKTSNYRYLSPHNRWAQVDSWAGVLRPLPRPLATR